MSEQIDWYCTDCRTEMEQQFTTCPFCQHSGCVVYRPQKQEAAPPTLGIHVAENLGAKATFGGSK